MTIRRILLIAFLLAGLIPATLLTELAFIRTRDAMQDEIERSLAQQAASVGADIDKMLFERLQNASTWNHLEVMQDLHVGDIDKRLATFLAEIKLRYGEVYLALHATDLRGAIVASSEPAAIGQQYPRAEAQRIPLQGGDATLQWPERRDDDALVIRTTIVSQFTGEALGELVLLCNWQSFERTLDRGAGADRGIVVLNADVVVAASTVLRERGIAAGQQLGGWSSSIISKHSRIRDGAPLMSGQVLTGDGRSSGYDHFRGLGWTTVIVQRLDQAFAPVHRMAWTFLTLLGVTAAVTILIAGWVSARIARPIVDLTAYTRRYTRDQALPEAPPRADGELGQLTASFVQMVEQLDHSRQTLVRASKLAAVGELAAMMAHELRTPLAVVKTAAQMLASEPAMSTESLERLGFIGTEADRLTRLVTEMLNSARARPLQRKTENVEEILHKSLSMMAAQAARQNVVLSRHFDAADAVAEVDAEQLLQVFLNLLVNALQVLVDGGNIRATIDDEPTGLVIEIADDGPGLPPGVGDRIFEPFVYQRQGGLGLGLAVVQQIVSAHGGRVLALNNPAGRGAMFRIHLPRSKTA